jgi:hypothetical protein
MTPNETEELPFRADFAARVLDAADAAVTRRRRYARGAAVAALVVLAGAVTLGMRPGVSPNVPRKIPAAAFARAGTPSLARDAQLEPLDYMFPDAASLARFFDNYADAYGGVASDSIVFSSDAENDAGEDSGN